MKKVLWEELKLKMLKTEKEVYEWYFFEYLQGKDEGYFSTAAHKHIRRAFICRIQELSGS